MEEEPVYDAENVVLAGHEPQVCHPLTDDEADRKSEYLRGYQEAAQIAIVHWKRALVSMLKFKGKARFGIMCCMTAHGFWYLLPHRDQSAIARHFHCTK